MEDVDGVRLEGVDKPKFAYPEKSLKQHKTAHETLLGKLQVRN